MPDINKGELDMDLFDPATAPAPEELADPPKPDRPAPDLGSNVQPNEYGSFKGVADGGYEKGELGVSGNSTNGASSESIYNPIPAERQPTTGMSSSRPGSEKVDSPALGPENVKNALESGEIDQAQRDKLRQNTIDGNGEYGVIPSTALMEEMAKKRSGEYGVLPESVVNNRKDWNKNASQYSEIDIAKLEQAERIKVANTRTPTPEYATLPTSLTGSPDTSNASKLSDKDRQVAAKNANYGSIDIEALTKKAQEESKGTEKPKEAEKQSKEHPGADKPKDNAIGPKDLLKEMKKDAQDKPKEAEKPKGKESFLDKIKSAFKPKEAEKQSKERPGADKPKDNAIGPKDQKATIADNMKFGPKNLKAAMAEATKIGVNMKGAVGAAKTVSVGDKSTPVAKSAPTVAASAGRG